MPIGLLFVFDRENPREYDRERQIFKEERENVFGRLKRKRENIFGRFKRRRETR